MPVTLCILDMSIIFKVKIVQKLISVIADIAKKYPRPEQLKSSSCKEPYNLVYIQGQIFHKILFFLLVQLHQMFCT